MNRWRGLGNETLFATEVNAEDRVTEMSDNVAPRDPLYLFACYLELRKSTNVAVYRELLAALDDPDPDIRCVAEVLLGRSSPYREPSDNSVQKMVK